VSHVIEVAFGPVVMTGPDSQGAPTTRPAGNEPGSPSCVSVRRGTDHDVVMLVGELDVATAPQVSPVVRGLLAEGRRRIVIDIDRVTFMDGFAFGVLLVVCRDVRRSGGCLHVVQNPLWARLLLVTRVDSSSVEQPDCDAVTAAER
jgi:anti-anti-sigma factor